MADYFHNELEIFNPKLGLHQAILSLTIVTDAMIHQIASEESKWFFKFEWERFPSCNCSLHVILWAHVLIPQKNILDFVIKIYIPVEIPYLNFMQNILWHVYDFGKRQRQAIWIFNSSLEISEDFVFHLRVLLGMQWKFLTAEISDSYNEINLHILFILIVMVENLSKSEIVNKMYQRTRVHVLREKQELTVKLLLQNECFETIFLFLLKRNRKEPLLLQYFELIYTHPGSELRITK